MSEKKTRILFIDDDREFLNKVVESINMLGFISKAVQNSREAINCFKSGDYNVVVTDICMPGMNGFEVIEAVHRHNSGTYVIALTGNPDKEIERAALKHGANAFLSKPLDLKELIQIISMIEDEPRRSKRSEP